MKSSSLLPVGVLVLGILATLTAEKDNLEKAGACPWKIPYTIPGTMKKGCTIDWHCPGKKKCCPDIYKSTCMDPVPIEDPVWKKPGNCFKPVSYCNNPEDHCISDGDCVKNLKCCRTFCGKYCAVPV